MKNNSVVVHTSALAKAKEEFDAFRKKQLQPASVSNPARAGAVAGSFEKLLYCTANPGERSRLVMEVTAEKATVTDAVKARPAQPGTGKTPSGDDSPMMSRTLEIARDYQGCPHCGSTGFVHCPRCGTLACWNGTAGEHPCPVCGDRSPIGRDGISLGFEQARQAARPALPEMERKRLLPSKGQRQIPPGMRIVGGEENS